MERESALNLAIGELEALCGGDEQGCTRCEAANTLRKLRATIAHPQPAPDMAEKTQEVRDANRWRAMRSLYVGLDFGHRPVLALFSITGDEASLDVDGADRIADDAIERQTSTQTQKD